MEKLREWFGSPTAAAKTLVWLMWTSLLISIALGVLLIVLATLPG